jgi:hypothetical protein
MHGFDSQSGYIQDSETGEFISSLDVSMQEIPIKPDPLWTVLASDDKPHLAVASAWCAFGKDNLNASKSEKGKSGEIGRGYSAG